MIMAERHDAILRELRLRGTLTTKDFADQLGISAITLRRDLRDLEDAGALVRVHGGAQFLRRRPADQPLRQERLASSFGMPPRGADDSPIATIGMIAPTNSYYYGEAIEGAKKAASIAGVRLTLAISEYQPSKELEILDRMINLGLDGVLITPALVPGGDDIRDAIECCPIPVTVVERAWEYPTRDHPVDSVRSDHAHGAEIAVRHLADLGHGRIALWTQNHAHHNEIKNGFAAAVTASGLDLVSSDFDNLHPEWKSDDLPSNARRYLTEIRKRGATAVLVYPDDFALAIAQEASSIGLDVPGDLSVVAYDDEFAGLAALPLTAVAPPKHAIGFAAIDACLRRTAGTGSGARMFPAQRTRLLPVLHVRESTTHPPGTLAGPDRFRVEDAAITRRGDPEAQDGGWWRAQHRISADDHF